MSSHVSDESDMPLFDSTGEVIGRSELHQLDWSESEETPLTSPTDPGDSRVADFKNQKVVDKTIKTDKKIYSWKCVMFEDLENPFN